MLNSIVFHFAFILGNCCLDWLSTILLTNTIMANIKYILKYVGVYVIQEKGDRLTGPSELRHITRNFVCLYNFCLEECRERVGQVMSHPFLVHKPSREWPSWASPPQPSKACLHCAHRHAACSLRSEHCGVRKSLPSLYLSNPLLLQDPALI